MEHVPVLLNEVISMLNIKDGGTYVDLTLGRAGHSSKILEAIPHGHLIGLDQDEVALQESRIRLEKIGSNFTLVHSNYSNLDKVLDELGISEVDGILADLGVSSPQLDDPERGFSYKEDAYLDMRMDQSSSLTAHKVVNSYSYEDLVRILFTYGEEKDAKIIAKNIVRQREIAPINSTLQLVEIIKRSKSARALKEKGHPAKQTFQAIRMEVNKETASLEAMLDVAPKYLKKGGRLVIITFMSLDDRLVKNKFRSLSVIEGSRHDPQPIQNEVAPFMLVNKKPIIADEEELLQNHRAASAKLRGIERR